MILGKGGCNQANYLNQEINHKKVPYLLSPEFKYSFFWLRALKLEVKLNHDCHEFRTLNSKNHGQYPFSAFKQHHSIETPNSVILGVKFNPFQKNHIYIVLLKKYHILFPF